MTTMARANTVVSFCYISLSHIKDHTLSQFFEFRRTQKQLVPAGRSRQGIQNAIEAHENRPFRWETQIPPPDELAGVRDVPELYRSKHR